MSIDCGEMDSAMNYTNILDDEGMSMDAYNENMGLSGGHGGAGGSGGMTESDEYAGLDDADNEMTRGPESVSSSSSSMPCKPNSQQPSSSASGYGFRLGLGRWGSAGNSNNNNNSQ